MNESALVQRIPFPSQEYVDRRTSARHSCRLEAVLRPHESGDALFWGATLLDRSEGGCGLAVCYPFRPGTYLTIDIQDPADAPTTLLARVVHVNDRRDGTWFVGCEYVKPPPDKAA